MRRFITLIESTGPIGSIGRGIVAICAAALCTGVSYGAETRAVTLITGDQVVIGSGKPLTATVHPREGRESIRFVTHYESVAATGEQHLYVIPEDAVALLGVDRLDQRLFDVTELLQSKYDDASDATLPLIVTYRTSEDMKRALAAGSAAVRELSIVNAVATNARKQDLGQWWDALLHAKQGSGTVPLVNSADKVWLDHKLQPPEVCTAAGCMTSAIIEAMQRAVTEQGAQIVNMGRVDPDEAEIDLIEQAAHQLNENYGTQLADTRREKPEQETYEVTIEHLDRRGAPTSRYVTVLVPLDARAASVSSQVQFGPAKITLRVPAGRYRFESILPGATPTVFVIPEHVLDANANFLFDARQAEPIDVQPPSATSQRIFTQAGWHSVVPWGQSRTDLLLSMGHSPPPVSPVLYVSTPGGSAATFTSYVTAQWVDPAAQSNAVEGAPLYAGVWIQHGRLPKASSLVLRKDRAAVVRQHYGNASRGLTQCSQGLGVGVNDAPVTWTSSSPALLPSRRTEFLHEEGGNARWLHELTLDAPDQVRFTSGANSYLPERIYFNRWNEPPFAPTLLPGAAFVSRTGNTVSVSMPLFGDRGGHAGVFGTSPYLELYRDGEKIGDANSHDASFAVPPGPAAYRLQATGTQEMFALSTRVNAVWTFESAHAADPVDVPLMTVNFEPRLNERGQAPREAPFELPITVHQAGKETPADVASLTLDASLDDGVTWQPIPVNRIAATWTARLNYPAHAAYVSLRATARDYSGNSVEQVVIRAYGIADALR